MMDWGQVLWGTARWRTCGSWVVSSWPLASLANLASADATRGTCRAAVGLCCGTAVAK
jgi:hypothetical protein